MAASRSLFVKCLIISATAHLAVAAAFMGLSSTSSHFSPVRGDESAHVLTVHIIDSLHPSTQTQATVSTQSSPAPPPSPVGEDAGRTVIASSDVPEGQTGQSTEAISNGDSNNFGRAEMSPCLQEVRSRLEHAKGYPWLARLRHQEGTVRLQFFMTPSGEPEDIRIVTSSGWKSLDEEALAIVQRVGQLSPLPVPCEKGLHIQVPLVFELTTQ